MANSITYIVGNGFDLSLGLETSYSHFYNHAQTNNLHPENRIYKAIRKDYETWADFEIALGKYTWYIKEKMAKNSIEQESIKFHEDLEEIRDDLADYLATQDSRIDTLAGAVAFNKHDFHEELHVGQRSKLAPLVQASPLKVNFITLNYTNTLEKTLPSRSILMAASNLSLGNIHHIHGDLLQNVTLGVSDESQLFDGMSPKERDHLIKPRLIAAMYDDRVETFRRLVDSSSVVVLYGTSIGESDKYIWEHVVEWLSLHSDRYIVVHKHDKGYTDKTKRSSRKHLQFTEAVKDRLLSNSTLDDSLKEKLKARIFVTHNTKKLFTIG